KVFTRLENALQRFLAFAGNFSDFEIKGKVSFLDDEETYTWKHYGKLPIHAPDWNFPRLREFQSKPLVGIHRLEVLCSAIERQVRQEGLDSHKEDKRSKGEELRWKGDWFLVPPAMAEALRAKHGDGWRFMFMCEGSYEAIWMHGAYYRKGEIPEQMPKDKFFEILRQWKQQPQSDHVCHQPDQALGNQPDQALCNQPDQPLCHQPD